MDYLDKVGQKRNEQEASTKERSERAQIEKLHKENTLEIVDTITVQHTKDRELAKEKKKVDVDNFPDLALRSDINKLVETVSKLSEDLKPESIDWQPLAQQFADLGKKLDTLPKQFPDLPSVPDKFSIENIEMIRDYLAPVVEAINSKDFAPVIKPNIEVKAPKVEVKPTDIKPFIEAVKELGQNLQVIVEGTKLDLGPLQEAAEKTTKAIKDIRFPIPNYILPFKDPTTGKATQVILTSDGKLPVEATMNVGDVEIGAVEIKDGSSDNRQTVEADGRANTNANLQVGDADVSALNPIPISGSVTSTGAGLAVSEALNLTSHNLLSAAYSGTTAISNDYRLTGLELHFTTSQKRTVTITTEDGVVLFKDTDVTYLDRMVPFDIFFNGGEELTLAITQTSGACSVSGKLTIAQGSIALEGNPVVEQGTDPWLVDTDHMLNVRSASRFFNVRGQRYIATTGYILQTANTAGELMAMFRNPSGSGQYVMFDKAEFGSTANARFSRYAGGTISLVGTPTARPIGRTDGGTSTSTMEIYTAGKTSPQFSVSVEGTLRKVAVMQAYQQYQLNEMDGTVVLAPGQTAYWRTDEPLGGGGTDYYTLIDFEWVEIPTATWTAKVAALQAKDSF